MASDMSGSMKSARAPARHRSRPVRAPNADHPPALDRPTPPITTPSPQLPAWPEAQAEPARGPNWLLVFGFFLLLAIVQTWPLTLHMNDHVIGWPGDSYVMWWNLDWVKDSLLSGSNPFHTESLYYPQGSGLYLHTLIPLNAVLSMPLQIATGNVLLSWNILALAFIALSGTGGYALAYHVTKDRWAALFAGFVFAFAPHVMMQLHGHLNIATTWPIPFFVLCLLRFFESRRKRDVVLIGLLAALMTWNWLEFAIDIALFSLVLFVFWAVLKARRGQHSEVPPLARALLPAVFLWAVLTAPILIPTALEIRSGDYTIRTGDHEANHYSPDLLAYAIPSPLWGGGEFSNNYLRPHSTRAGSIETTMFLGFTPLVLAIVALAYRKQSPLRASIGFWSMVFAFFAVMSLGPQLHVFGGDTHVPLPFKILQQVPLIGERRVPGRMIIVGMLALGVLGAIGISTLAKRFGGSLKHAGPVFACSALAMVAFEYWNPPVSLATYDVPSIYYDIGKQDGDFAVLDLPLGRITGNSRAGDVTGGALSDYAQVIHGKPAVGGYLSRAEDSSLEWLVDQPGLGYLACLNCWGYPRAIDQDPASVRSLFRHLRIKYVVMNLRTFEGDTTSLLKSRTAPEAEAYIEETLGFQQIDSGDGWIAYRNPGVE